MGADQPVSGGASLDSPALVVDGQTVIAAVDRRPTSSPTTLELEQFSPTVLTGASALRNAQLVPEPSPSASVDHPQLVPGSPPRLLIPDPYAGSSIWSLATPTTPVKSLAFWTPYSGSVTSAIENLDALAITVARPTANGSVVDARGLTEVWSGRLGQHRPDVAPREPEAASTPCGVLVC